MSLGRSRGAVLLGRSLDISVQATLDAQEAVPEANCFTAEVFYGESRVPPAAVQIGVEKGAGSEVRVLVRSSRVVDEPVVTVYLRSSCSGNASRRYVLLSDSPTEQDNAAAVVNTQSPRILPPALPPALPAVALPTAPAASVRTDTPAASSAREQEQQRLKTLREERRAARQAERQAKLEARQATAEKPAPQVALQNKNLSSSLSPRKPVAEDKKPRLQLDLLDISATAPGLRGSGELLSVPTADEAVRQQARALWRSLSVSAESAAQEQQNLNNLQAQFKQSQDLAKKQSTEITTLRTELETAKRERYLNPWTIGLGILTLLGLMAAIFFARRGGMSQDSGGSPWWRSKKELRSEEEEMELWEHIDTKKPPGAVTPPAPAQSSMAALLEEEAGLERGDPKFGSFLLPDTAQTDLDKAAGKSQKISPSGGSTQPLSYQETAAATALAAAAGAGQSSSSVTTGLPSPVSTSKKPVTPKADFAASDFGMSAYTGMPSSRVANAEELFDIQEQADFFLSLGQPDQAIEILKNHISDNVEMSALAYMDLFDIYHKLNRQPDYSALREEFNRVFNAQVPEFSAYSADSRGLEDYPVALRSIQALWPTAGVLDVIEESIFRKPDARSKPFDMQAYRELMLLYSMAKEVTSSTFGPLTTVASASKPPPLSTKTTTDLAQLDAAPSPMESLNVALSNSELSFSLDHPPDLVLGDQATPVAAKDNGLDFDLSQFHDSGKPALPPLKRKT